MSSRHEFMEYISVLEADVHKRWMASDYCNSTFSSIAASALERTLERTCPDYDDLIEWLASSPPLPNQARLDLTFGQPPITLIWNGAFQLDLLFWTTADTAVHGHGFAGAFAVLAGESLHFTFAVETGSECCDHFKLGNFKRRKIEKLEPGQVRAIIPGSEAMHALVHMGRPSISLVLRTCGNAPGLREFVGFLPGVLLSPLPELPLRKRQIQLVKAVNGFDRQRASRLAVGIAKTCDIHTGFLLLCMMPGDADLARTLESRYGSAMKQLEAAAAQEKRRQLAESLSRKVQDPLAKILLACLLFNDASAGVFADIGHLFPGEDQVALVTQGLARILDLTSDDTQIFDAIAARLQTEPTVLPVSQPDPLSGLVADLANHPLFKPLFTNVLQPEDAT